MPAAVINHRLQLLAMICDLTAMAYRMHEILEEQKLPEEARRAARHALFSSIKALRAAEAELHS